MKFKEIVLILLWIIEAKISISVPINFEKSSTTCGYDSCHAINENKINVHLVPHSHNDLGWLKTFDQYYYGSENNINTVGVQYIIKSVVEALDINPDRRFIQVETGYLSKWWKEQENATKEKFIKVLNNGQLEIVNGAWSMNDEGATNYQSIIDQYTWGFRFLNDTLGNCAKPKVGWQIDPFGHSQEQSSILKQLGFDGLFIGRLDYRDKDKRREQKALDFLWKSSSNLEGDNNLFTSIFPDFYTSPDGYCWDINCKDKPIIDNKESPSYNLNYFIKDFSSKVLEYAKYYQTQNILIPMGGEFHYQGAEINFLNLDRLIKGFKDNDNITLIYSTPSCYIKAVNEESVKKSIKFPIKTYDFFPHATDPDAFWSGYYTSRPNFKRLERIGSRILQAFKQLTSLYKIYGNNYNYNSLNDLREVMGIVQHHDAITGTAKQIVSQDYTNLLTKAIKNTEEPFGQIISKLLKKVSDQKIDLNLKICLLANVSICDITNNENQFMVVVYNSLSRPVTHYVHLPIQEGNYTITGPDGDEIYDMFNSISSFDFIDNNAKINPKTLIFEAKNIPGFGLKLYYVKKISSTYDSYNDQDDTDNYYGTKTTGFSIDPKTSKLKSVTINGHDLEITQEFLFYKSANGDNNITDNHWERRASGAYIFRPFQNSTKAETVTDKIKSLIIKRGEIVDEVKQIITDKLTQIIRVYKGGNNNYIEFDWLLGDLDVDVENEIGKEIISRFTINEFYNSGIFYTDSNGREMLRRQRNKRNDFDYNPDEEPIASNYYPVTSRILFKDDKKNWQVAVVNDRAQGGSNLEEGVIELMIHRRILKDDAFGVEEPLNEMEFGKGVYVRGKHYLIHGSNELPLEGKSVSAQEVILAQEKLFEPLILIGSSNNLTLEILQKFINFEFSSLKAQMPENVNILTLEPWKDDTYLFRLEHFLEKNKDHNLSKPTSVNLKDLFTSADITQINETILGANQWLEDYNKQPKFQWKSSINEEDILVTTSREVASYDDSFQIILNPMQIRSFIIKIVRRNHKDDDDNNNSNNLQSLSVIILVIIAFYNYSLA